MRAFAQLTLSARDRGAEAGSHRAALLARASLTAASLAWLVRFVCGAAVPAHAQFDLGAPAHRQNLGRDMRFLFLGRHGIPLEHKGVSSISARSHLGRFHARFPAKMLEIAPLFLRFLRGTWREIGASCSVGRLKTLPRNH